MVGVELPDGFGLWAEDEIASWTPERGQRWRLVHAQGIVGHRWSGPQSSQPWLPYGPSHLHPKHLRPHTSGYLDPAGFIHPAGHPPGHPPDHTPGHTPDPLPAPAPGHPRQHPLARLIRIKGGYRAQDANGQELAPWSHAQAQQMAQEHGCQLDSPWAELRDWPHELARAEADWLRQNFQEPRALLRQLCYQAVRYRELGQDQSYGSTHRGFWYDPIVSTLHRTGLVQPPHSEDTLYQLYGRILEEMVGRDRIFTYTQLGFADPGGRWIGSTRPEVLLFVEKDSLKNYALACHQRFGLSLWLSGGAPKLIAAEYLAQQLNRKDLRMLAYVDFDPAGWSGAEAAAEQLRALGLHVTGPEFVIRAQDFTPEEQELFAIPCPIANQAMKTKTRRWLQKSGGVEGRARGIHCNHLKPIERLLQRIEEML